uniref:Uncharacterized protein n=1 Tax=Noctiluca scintillans TaxID=2966 RepID=A0A7S1AV35_NOCSC|mmetsp:Transcript_61141/g.162441  ORF Transcript_61141/g.162441 Transcript_61141/m.162441 type:complete len:306 (+) Transcript_61141:145-1062(+)
MIPRQMITSELTVPLPDTGLVDRVATADPSFRLPVSSDQPQTASCRAASLNLDPFNLAAEELAMTDCCQGVEVRRTWAETELVRTFGGHQFPGTPDGMFEDWCGTLTCVQVVRVPLVLGMNSECMQRSLAQTVLVKIVKSQTWLRATECAPHEFIIFCWLPFSVPLVVVEYSDSLMDRVRQLDPRFSLRLRVPARPGSLFPALFASNRDGKLKHCLSCSDLATFGGSADDTDDVDFEWDITWDWASEVQEQPYSQVDEVNMEREHVQELSHGVQGIDPGECDLGYHVWLGSALVSRSCLRDVLRV